MTVTEALKILQAARKQTGVPYPVAVVCGFTPLHLETFLAAHLQQRMPDKKIAVTAGLFENVAGTLETSHAKDIQSVALALEWADLDPRLGFRNAGQWGPGLQLEIPQSARNALDRIAAAIENLPPGATVACSLPTLPLPPLFHNPGWQTAETELELERLLAEFASRCLARRGLAVVNRQRLAEESPPAGRHDFKSELLSGLPYSVTHADCVAESLARLLAPPAPKKGLITDLDDTLWHGIVGEVGPENVTWDLASHQHLHGLYQKLLAALSAEGVLVAVASKNDAEIARQAMGRPDILLPPDRVFPVEIHWNAKSGSVEKILKAWNIGADSVVFVDDSPMELAEVAAAHPGIECLQFPRSDAAAGYALLRRLRDLFGKPRLAEEDAIRLESIRQGAVFQNATRDSATAEEFLRQAEAVVTLDCDPMSSDPRTLELVNKTNQFNLNGRRYTEAEWSSRRERPCAVLLAAGYRDKFGPLGKIAVIEGWQESDTLYIETWVMSCRAFARRIEYQCLKALFDRSGAGKVVFDFAATAKNGPLRDFLESVAGTPPAGTVELTRSRFEEVCPPLYHRIEETQSSKEPWIQSQPA